MVVPPPNQLMNVDFFQRKRFGLDRCYALPLETFWLVGLWFRVVPSEESVLCLDWVTGCFAELGCCTTVHGGGKRGDWDSLWVSQTLLLPS